MMGTDNFNICRILGYNSIQFFEKLKNAKYRTFLLKIYIIDEFFTQTFIQSFDYFGFTQE